MAQEKQTISVSPAILPVTLIPGTTQTYELTITNTSNTSLPIQLSPESFQASDEDGGYLNTSARSPILDWMRITPIDLIVNGNSSRTVTVSVTIPAKVAVGGYYAIIYLTPVVPEQPGQNPRVIGRVGIPIFASLGIDEKLHTATIETFSMTPRLSQQGNFSTRIRVQNTGLSHFSAKPFLRFTPTFGNDTKSMELPEKVILPGKIRHWEQSAVKNLPYNWYTVTLELSTGGGNWIRQTQTVIVAPVRELSFTLIISIILLLYLSFRKNIKKALKELFR